MIGNKHCVRCKDSHLVRVDHSDPAQIRVGLVSFIQLELGLCPRCGYTEFGVASKEDLQKVKEKYNLPD
jgi:hypothetical protein